MEYFCQSLALGLARIPLVFLRGFCSSQHLNIFPTFAEYGTNKKQKRLLRSKTTNSHILTCVEPRSSLDVEASRPGLRACSGRVEAHRGTSRRRGFILYATSHGTTLRWHRGIELWRRGVEAPHRGLTSRHRGRGSVRTLTTRWRWRESSS